MIIYSTKKMSFNYNRLSSIGNQKESFVFGLKKLALVSRRGSYFDVDGISYTVKNTAIDSVERTYSDRYNVQNFITLTGGQNGYDTVDDVLDALVVFIEKLFLSNFGAYEKYFEFDLNELREVADSYVTNYVGIME